MRSAWSRIWWSSIIRADFASHRPQACKSLALWRGILLFRGRNTSEDRRMPALSRRTILATAAAGLAAAALPARAASAPARFMHGAYEVLVVGVGLLVLPVSFLAGEAPAAERVSILMESG